MTSEWAAKLDAIVNQTLTAVRQADVKTDAKALEMYATLCMIVAVAAALVYIGSKRGLESTRAMTAAPETLTMADAAKFPVNGSIALFSMYVLVKYIPSEYVGMLLGFYLTVFAVFALNYSVRPILGANVFVGVASIAVGALYIYTNKHWILTNVFAVSIAVLAISQMVVGSFPTGAILLVGLFFYDIFWVFGTDVMVSVATNIDGPIKILMPQAPFTWHTDNKSLLGLGDIVIPGFYIALMCVFSTVGRDYIKTKAQAKKGKNNGTVLKPSSSIYFVVAMIAYILSLASTMVVMIVFKHAQPALLYIVPWLLITTLALAAVKGEIPMLLEFDIGQMFVVDNKTDDATEAASDSEKVTEAPSGDEDGVTSIIKDFFGFTPQPSTASATAVRDATNKKKQE